MKTRMLGLTIVVLYAGSLAVSSQARGQWSTIEVPGASTTLLYDVEGDKLVGEYSAGGIGHGFLYDGANWITLDAFGETWDTTIRGIDGDNLVGSHVSQGFLYDGATWTPIDRPGAIVTYPYGIEGENLVGWYDNGPSKRGFLYDGSNWVDIDAPGATEGTFIYDIDGGRFVGSFRDTVGSHGFIYDGTDWQTLDMPGATHTTIYGIDGNNLVGRYFVGTSEVHGFLYDGASWMTLDMPGATWTWPMGIDGDKIVGTYDTPGVSGAQSFMYVIPEPGAVAFLMLGSLWVRRRR